DRDAARILPFQSRRKLKWQFSDRVGHSLQRRILQSRSRRCRQPRRVRDNIANRDRSSRAALFQLLSCKRRNIFADGIIDRQRPPIKPRLLAATNTQPKRKRGMQGRKPSDENYKPWNAAQHSDDSEQRLRRPSRIIVVRRALGVSLR